MGRQLIAYHIFPSGVSSLPGPPRPCLTLRKLQVTEKANVIDSSCLVLPSPFDLSTTTD